MSMPMAFKARLLSLGSPLNNFLFPSLVLFLSGWRVWSKWA